jgi:hypothetical protein
MQPFTVELPADQHQSVLLRSDPLAFVERKPFPDQVEDVPLVAAIDPENALAAEDLVRQLGIEKMLKFIEGERLIAYKRDRAEPVAREMIVTGIGMSRMFGFASSSRIPVRLKGSVAKDQRERHCAAGSADNPRVRSDRTDFVFERSQIFASGEIAFVEENDIRVAQLIVGRRAVEQIEAEIIGIGNRNDPIEADPIAKIPNAGRSELSVGDRQCRWFRRSDNRPAGRAPAPERCRRSGRC